MNPIRLILAATLGLAIGIVATWFVLHRAPPAPAGSSTSADSVLYWYDPMVPDQHFDKPGKSPFMDMQLVPKRAGNRDEAAGVVNIDPREVQNLGVRTDRAERGTLTSTVHATGTVAFDERAVTVVQAKLAGTVSTTSCAASLRVASSLAKAKSHASRRCARSAALTSTGDRFGTSGGAPHGRIAARRSTPGWQSHDLAEAIRRPGTFAPCARASSPVTSSPGFVPSGFHGSLSCSAGRSCSPTT